MKNNPKVEKRKNSQDEKKSNLQQNVKKMF